MRYTYIRVFGDVRIEKIVGLDKTRLEKMVWLDKTRIDIF